MRGSWRAILGKRRKWRGIWVRRQKWREKRERKGRGDYFLNALGYINTN